MTIDEKWAQMPERVQEEGLKRLAYEIENWSEEYAAAVVERNIQEKLDGEWKRIRLELMEQQALKEDAA